MAHEIEYSDGEKITVEYIDCFLLKILQHKKVIVNVDGQPFALFGMTDDEIEAEFKRIESLKNKP